MTVLSGWRAAIGVLVLVLVVGVLLAAVFWIGLLLGVLAVVGWFNLLVIPRVAARLRVPEIVPAGALLPALAAAGLLLAGFGGVVAGCLVWVIGVAVPRVLLWRFRRRLWHGIGGTQLRRVRVIDARFNSSEPA